MNKNSLQPKFSKDIYFSKRNKKLQRNSFLLFQYIYLWYWLVVILVFWYCFLTRFYVASPDCETMRYTRNPKLCVTCPNQRYIQKSHLCKQNDRSGEFSRCWHDEETTLKSTLNHPLTTTPRFGVATPRYAISSGVLHSHEIVLFNFSL